MKKSKSTFHLVVNTLFIGLLLSFFIFYVTDMLIDDTTAPTCYDGSQIEGSNISSDFRRSVYQNETVLSFIREYQFRLFGIVDDNAAVIGSHSFLFEVRNDQTDYSFLEDYTGNLSFTDEELAAILEELNARKEFCAQNGARYLLVVIPNSQTVYSEYMPSYLGSISKKTRLTRLQNYLTEQGFLDFMSLTSHLKIAKKDGQLYNNTENSLNTLGLYHAYLATYKQISGYFSTRFDPVERDTLNFYRYVTDGRETARKAGLEKIALNRTTTLADNADPNYFIWMNSGLYKTTRQPDCEEDDSLLLQFTSTWNQAQSERFFSATFPEVSYQSRTDLSKETFDITGASVVVQFIGEDELSLLLR